MPTYEYKCEGCGYRVDKFESIRSSGRSRVCPNCMRPSSLRRQIGSGGGVIFRGPDWPGRDIARGGVKDENPKTEAST